MMRWLMFTVLLLLAGCGGLAPATPPAQLGHTPGPAVILSDDRYVSTVFSAAYPQGWQVVTSAAFSLPWVVFISPDESALIVLALDADDTQISPPAPPADAPLRRHTEMRPLDPEAANSLQVVAVMVAPAAAWEGLWPLYERVVASLQATEQNTETPDN